MGMKESRRKGLAMALALERDDPENAAYKFFKMEMHPAQYPVSENLYKQKQNFAYAPYNPNCTPAAITFSLQYNQTASLKLYEYKGGPIELSDFELGRGGAPVAAPKPATVGAINVSGPAIGYLTAYNATGGADPEELPWPLCPKNIGQESLAAQLDAALEGLKNGTNLAVPVIGMEFFGYDKKNLPGYFKPRGGGAEAGFVHNILLWDGGVADANGAPVDVGWDKNKTYILVLDTEAVAPEGNDFNSYLAFKADPDAPSWLSGIEFDELLNILGGDPVDMVDGSLVYERTDLKEEGTDPLAFTAAYRSRDAGADYGLGYGWSHNHMYSVLFGQATAMALLPDGKKACFRLDYDGQWASREGSEFSFCPQGEGGSEGFLMTAKDGTIRIFDSEGKIARTTAMNGESTEYTYSPQGRLDSITNRSGSLAFSYNSGNRISAVTDSSGRSVKYFYDGNGDLVASENCDESGNSLAYTYTGHLLKTAEDFLGTVYMANTYDSAGRVVSQYVEGQGTSVFAYDPANRVNTITGPADPQDPLAKRKFMKVRYDESGRVTAVEDNDGTAGYEYDSANQMASSTDKMNNTTRYEHGDDGNISLITYPDETTRGFEYYDNKLVKTVTQADTSTLEFRYDERGNLTGAKDGNGNWRYWHYDENNDLEWYKDALEKYTYYRGYDGKGNAREVEDALGNTTIYSYDSVGRLAGVETPLGFETTYAYSDAGKLKDVENAKKKHTVYEVNGNGFNESSTDPMGFTVSYGYDGTSHVTYVKDAEGNTTQYRYNENGYRVETEDAEGNTTLYGYDPLGKLTSATTPRGHTTEYKYYASGQLWKTEDPLGNAAERAYDCMGRLSEEKDARGNSTLHEYDAMGRLWKTTDPEDGVTEREYDFNGNLVLLKDPEQNETQYFYDAENRLIEKKDAEGNSWLYTYDELGRLAKTTTPLGSKNESGYDADGRRTLGRDAHGFETEYEYDGLGRMSAQLNSDGTSLAYEYNDNGWLVSVTNEEGETMGYAYFDNGWVRAVTDYMGFTTAYTYTKTGQVETVTDAECGVTAYSYFADGSLESATDPENFTAWREYDECGRLRLATDPRGGEVATAYDENGNVASVTNADLGVTLYEYDKNNRLRFRTDPENNVFETQYDMNGNVVKEIDGRGNFKEFVYDKLNRAVEAKNELGHSSYKEYDADGRLVRLENEEGAETFYEYDKKNQLKKITDALGNETVFEYDTMGRVLTETDARGAVASYAYTPTGLVASITRDVCHDPGAAVKEAVTSYSYNANGWLVSETNPKNETVLYVHDMLGRVVEKRDAMGESEHFAYDANSRITKATDREGNATKYFYDGNGNVVKTVDAMGTAAEFGYDPANRLESVKLHRVDARHGVDEFQVTLYEYSKNGLVTKQINAVGNEKIHVYDGNGNLVQTTDEDGYATMYGYDPRNLIEAINYDSGNGKEASFGYNKAGQLVEMVDWNGTTEFALDALGRIAETTDHGCNTASSIYDGAGNRVQLTYPDSAAASWEYDLLGRLVALTDAEGEVTAYSYDAARLTGMEYPNGWSESYTYNANGWLTKQTAIDPSGSSSDPIAHSYEYDLNGNIKKEKRSGAGGQDAFERDHKYDALDRLVETTAQIGQKDRDYDYFYDSLGNLVYEENANGANKGNEYWYDSLNQQVRKVADNHDEYLYSFDLRGNLVEGRYQGNGSSANRLEEQYAYDATNRMVKGIRYKGTSVAYEESHYVYNGFGDLVANEWIIAKNAYGYTGIDSSPSEQVNGVVVCDRHAHTTGQGHQNPTGNGHTTGGTEGGAAPAVNGHQAVVHKDFVLDYASPLKNVVIELESGDDPNGRYLKYRCSYGLRKTSTAVTGFDTLFYAMGGDPEPDSGIAEYSVGEGGELELVSEEGFLLNSFLQQYGPGTPGGPQAEEAFKLFHHQDRLGVTDYLTAAAEGGKVMGYVTYDDWGALTAKAVLNCRVRQLDLVQDYTGHPYDQVLAVYYAKARMYDAIDRRFMAVDPVKGTVRDPQTMVQYNYVLNNPVLYLDPTGLETASWAKHVGNNPQSGSDYTKTVINNALAELQGVSNMLESVRRDPDFSQNSLYYKNLADISKLQSKIREIEKNPPSVMLPKVGSAYTYAELLLYSYYPKLACASVSARSAAREMAALIYDSGWQYGGVKSGGYLDGTNANAFVHSMWNAIMFTQLVNTWGYTKKEAEELIWLASAMHEYSEVFIPSVHWLSNVNMDMHNNEKGIEIAKVLVDNKYTYNANAFRMADLAVAIVNAVDSGEMVRNRYIDYNTQYNSEEWFDRTSFTLRPTSNSEKLLNQEQQIRNVIVTIYSR